MRRQPAYKADESMINDRRAKLCNLIRLTLDNIITSGSNTILSERLAQTVNYLTIYNYKTMTEKLATEVDQHLDKFNALYKPESSPTSYPTPEKAAPKKEFDLSALVDIKSILGFESYKKNMETVLTNHLVNDNVDTYITDIDVVYEGLTDEFEDFDTRYSELYKILNSNYLQIQLLNSESPLAISVNNNRLELIRLRIELIIWMLDLFKRYMIFGLRNYGSDKEKIKQALQPYLEKLKPVTVKNRIIVNSYVQILTKYVNYLKSNNIPIDDNYVSDTIKQIYAELKKKFEELNNVLNNE
jgi:hypothetical protein